MGDISENIDITVEGADALEEAAAKAEEFAEALKQARDAFAELDATGEGADAAAEVAASRRSGGARNSTPPQARRGTSSPRWRRPGRASRPSPPR